MTEESLTPDKINGMPVWKLTSVRLTNQDLIHRTDAWIHFSDLGDEGWSLMAPEAQITSWRDGLAIDGITVEPWP